MQVMIWLRSVFHLGAAIASFINAFDPEIVIVGGGIAQAGVSVIQPSRKLPRQV